jgi:hypothetical protein
MVASTAFASVGEIESLTRADLEAWEDAAGDRCR